MRANDQTTTPQTAAKSSSTAAGPAATAQKLPGGTTAVPLLSVRSLQKVYSSPGGDVEAVRNLTFDLPEGQLACLVGPSGCGKTTLLRAIAGLLRPTSGEVRLNGAPVLAPPRSMAVVFQEYGRSLFPWMSVYNNVELPLRGGEFGARERRRIVEEALDAVGLSHVSASYPWQLSGGMQQRVAIARAVAYRPSILLMDEPFAAVDAQTRADLEDLIRGLWRRLGITILFVTHDIDESIYLGERVIMLSNSPTVVQDDLRIDLPVERDQLITRSLPRFAELRAHVYTQIQRAKYADRGGAVT
jgi:NitT/TauT family transport system ATP-binding protein